MTDMHKQAYTRAHTHTSYSEHLSVINQFVRLDLKNYNFTNKISQSNLRILILTDSILEILVTAVVYDFLSHMGGFTCHSRQTDNEYRT